eukprot:1147972-Pelagomonas_calceolata.AAC.8
MARQAMHRLMGAIIHVGELSNQHGTHAPTCRLNHHIGCAACRALPRPLVEWLGRQSPSLGIQLSGLVMELSQQCCLPSLNDCIGRVACRVLP